MTSRPRLHAPLFDRLAQGDAPSMVDPDRFTERSLRETVRRDVAWLLNTTRLGAAVELDGLPEVERSVLNYGVPDLAGKSHSHRAVLARARDIREALRRFEPRLDEESLAVEPAPERERENAVTFHIHADIRSVQPVPVRFKTDVESDGAGVAVRD